MSMEVTNDTVFFWIKFDDEGKRQDTVPETGLTAEEKESLLAAGYKRIGETNYKKLLDFSGGANGTGYVFSNGGIADAPEKTYTQAEAADAVHDNFLAAVEAANENILLALAANDTETAASFRAAKSRLMDEYKTAQENAAVDVIPATGDDVCPFCGKKLQNYLADPTGNIVFKEKCCVNADCPDYIRTMRKTSSPVPPERTDEGDETGLIAGGGGS